MTKNNDQVSKNVVLRRLFRLALAGGAICALGLTLTVLAQGGLAADNKKSTTWHGIVIDRDRVEPRSKGPEVPVIPGTVAILLHHQSENREPIVVLRIPEQYVHSYARQNDSIGLALTVTYPDLKGAFASENRDLFSCTGLCRGRMFIELMNYTGFRGWHVRNGLPGFLINPDPLEKLRKPIDGLGTFDEAYSQPLYTIKNSSLVNVYIQKDRHGEITSLVKCEPDTPVPYCDEWMESKRIGMLIHYTFQYRFMNDWHKVHQSVLDLVDSFFVNTLKPI